MNDIIYTFYQDILGHECKISYNKVFKRWSYFQRGYDACWMLGMRQWQYIYKYGIKK